MKKMKRFITVLTALTLVSGFSAPVFSGSNVIPCVSAAEAPADVIDSLSSEMRSHMVARDTEFSITIPIEYASSDTVKAVITGSLEDTGKPDEGDYIRWHLSRYSYSSSGSASGVNVNFKIVYKTTAEQEKAVDAKVKSILAGLNVGSGSEYEKISAVYDYVVANIEYASGADGSDPVIFSAYGAAVNGSAVCQGYSLLFYRLLRELGVNCRAIPGYSGGGSHMWNIAEIGGRYYLLDSTFDSTLGRKKGNYVYFLKGSNDFDLKYPDYVHEFAVQNPGSPLLAELERDDFFVLHPISPYEYDPTSAPVVTTTIRTTTKATTTKTTVTTTAPVTTKPSGNTDPGTVTYILGDINGDGALTAADASMALAAYAQLSTTSSCSLTYTQQLAADVNKDGNIDASDASYILSYYSYVSTGGSIGPEEFFKQIGG